MKKISIIVIFLFLGTCIGAQEHKDLRSIKDSIEKYSVLLTGKWQLIGFFNKDKFVETELSMQLGDTVTEIKILTDSGFIKKTIQNNRLIKISKIKEIDLIEMSFKKNGKGYYQHYPDYNIDSNLQTLLTCQPIPEIKFQDEKLVLHFTSMTGEYEEDFIVEGDNLIIRRDNDLEERYFRYKKLHVIE